MPAQGALSGSLIDTGEIYQDCISNVIQLIKEHRDQLKFKWDTGERTLIDDNIKNYDALLVYDFPTIAVAYETSLTELKRIGNCYEISISLSIFYYFFSLQFGSDTYPFLKPLYRLMEMFVVHQGLYGFTNGTNNGITVTGNSLVGRRLNNDTVLTGQLSLLIYKRLCAGEHEGAP